MNIHPSNFRYPLAGLQSTNHASASLASSPLTCRTALQGIQDTRDIQGSTSSQDTKLAPQEVRLEKYPDISTEWASQLSNSADASPNVRRQPGPSLILEYTPERATISEPWGNDGSFAPSSCSPTPGAYSVSQSENQSTMAWNDRFWPTSKEPYITPLPTDGSVAQQFIDNVTLQSAKTLDEATGGFNTFESQDLIFQDFSDLRNYECRPGPDGLRRPSLSSASLSSSGPMTEVPSFEDLTTLNHNVSSLRVSIDGRFPTNSNTSSPLEFSSNQRTRLESGVHRRLSNSAREYQRPSPYPQIDRRARWSKGPTHRSPGQSPSHSVSTPHQGHGPHGPRTPMIFPPPAISPQESLGYTNSSEFSDVTNLFASQFGRFGNHTPSHSAESLGLQQFENASASLFHGATPKEADAPDLYASLKGRQERPIDTDMYPLDPQLLPHEQELRFEGDLYTPRFIRGHGHKREGWCSFCGRWLVLKNSAFWYHCSFFHGISAATGQLFKAPLDFRRSSANSEVWEGLCGNCRQWVSLVNAKKKGTSYFRHAYKVSYSPFPPSLPKAMLRPVSCPVHLYHSGYPTLLWLERFETDSI